MQKVIPVNASGTISIVGKLHTTDGINMRAAHINIGTSEDGKTVNKDALLKTGVTDFSDLVNITSNGSIVTNEGLGKNLTVSKTQAGDIVLSAIATERNAKDSIFDGSTTDNNMVHASVVNKGRGLLLRQETWIFRRRPAAVRNTKNILPMKAGRRLTNWLFGDRSSIRQPMWLLTGM
jgi:hypothetical protein